MSRKAQQVNRRRGVPLGPDPTTRYEGPALAVIPVVRTPGRWKFQVTAQQQGVRLQASGGQE